MELGAHERSEYFVCRPSRALHQTTYVILVHYTVKIDKVDPIKLLKYYSIV